ncbi:MAG: T9SS type A sorting domain-containing protein [Chitinophagaceae bacterium]|nr:T9SS type A sorting domain-containing protein [Chitinophagaceae bacterium]
MKLKTTLFKSMILACSMMLLSVMSFAGNNNYTCSVKNIHQINAYQLEFDIWIEATTNDPMKFQCFQGGLNFNYDGIANGGTITGEFVKGSAYDKLPKIQQNPNWVINAHSKQIRLLPVIATPSSIAMVIPTMGGFKVGTFRMTNTVPFTANATPDFSWSFASSTANVTKSMVTTYNANKSVGQSMTVQTTFSQAKQGPQHFVLENPVLNPGAITLNNDVNANGNASVIGGANSTSTSVKVYPNPASSTLNVDLFATTTQNGIVKIYDQQGRKVKQIEAALQLGHNNIAISLGDLASGIYTVQVYEGTAQKYTTNVNINK